MGSLATLDLVGRDISSAEVLLRSLDLLGDQLSTASRQRLLSTLRGFCGFLVRRGVISSDPTTADELVVRSDTATDVAAFTAEQVLQLVDACDAPTSSRAAWPTRDRAMVLLLADCGLRVAELAALEARDLDRSGDTVLARVRHGTKGGRKRVVPVPARTVAAIDDYLDEWGTATTTKQLLLRRDGQLINQQFVYSRLLALCRTADIDPPTGALPHAMRHTYGMTLAARGVPLPLIQQLMGHVDPRVTTIYTRAHATDLTDAMRHAGLL